MLSTTKIENAKAKEKPYKLYDAEGLYVLVNPNGSKLWRFRYQFDPASFPRTPRYAATGLDSALTGVR